MATQLKTTRAEFDSVEPVTKRETQNQTVGELGESGVLRRVLAQFQPAEAASLGPGDDSAVLNLTGQLVVTTDTMIEGPDFRAAWHSGFELGWKLAATNLSDVAAMGARPIGLTVALAVPRDTSVELLEEIAQGLQAACAALAPGCGVVGGDLGTAPVLTAAVTALGDLEGRAAITRSGANVGDTVAYAGELGLAGLGLSLLFAESAAEDGTAHSDGLGALWAEHPEALSAQLSPVAPIPLGVTAAEAGATAMMDVSDGLSIDGDRLAQASCVVLDLSSELLASGFGSQIGEDVPLEAMLTGGEDHGLLATFAADTALPQGFHAIGKVVLAKQDEQAKQAAESASALMLDGEPFAPRGWDPFVALHPGS